MYNFRNFRKRPLHDQEEEGHDQSHQEGAQEVLGSNQQQTGQDQSKEK